MAVPPHHGVMGSHCTGFLDQSNYPQPTGTRPVTMVVGSSAVPSPYHDVSGGSPMAPTTSWSPGTRQPTIRREERESQFSPRRSLDCWLHAGAVITPMCRAINRNKLNYRLRSGQAGASHESGSGRPSVLGT